MSYQLSSVALRQARTMRRNQNSVRYTTKTIGLGPISNTLMLALILVVIGLMYLTQITKTNAFGYQVNDLKEKKEQLVEENKSLQVEAARLQSLERIKSSKVANRLGESSQVYYTKVR